MIITKEEAALGMVQFLAKSNFFMLHVILCVEKINIELSFLHDNQSLCQNRAYLEQFQDTVHNQLLTVVLLKPLTF